MVSVDAGVAERYPPELRDLLLPDVEDVDELCARLRRWRGEEGDVAARMRPFADQLRTRSWDDMAAEIVELLS
jgi:hypothetical protein